MKVWFTGKCIFPQDILHAFEDDEEMYQVLTSCIVPGAGVRPYIHTSEALGKERRHEVKEKYKSMKSHGQAKWMLQAYLKLVISLF